MRAPVFHSVASSILRADPGRNGAGRSLQGRAGILQFIMNHRHLAECQRSRVVYGTGNDALLTGIQLAGSEIIDNPSVKTLMDGVAAVISERAISVLYSASSCRRVSAAAVINAVPCR